MDEKDIVRIFGKARFKPRSDTLENWQSKNPVLLAGEPGIVIDGNETVKIKFGDGATPWNELDYWLGPKGEPGKDAETDQTYNPESENAQSGRALAPEFGKKFEQWSVGKTYKVGDAVIFYDRWAFGFEAMLGICVEEHPSPADVSELAEMFSEGTEPFLWGYVDRYWNWQSFTPYSVEEAVYALRDINGNIIPEHYATKSEVAALAANYELIAKIIIGYTVLITQPEDWESNYSAYYQNTGTAVEPVYTKLTSYVSWEEGKYYTFSLTPADSIKRIGQPDGSRYSFKNICIRTKLSVRGSVAAGSNTQVQVFISTSASNPSTINTPPLYCTATESKTDFYFWGDVCGRILKVGSGTGDIACKSYTNNITLRSILFKNTSILSGDSEIWIYGVRA